MSKVMLRAAGMTRFTIDAKFSSATDSEANALGKTVIDLTYLVLDWAKQ